MNNNNIKIPILYKDYGRKRGCVDSAKHYEYLINKILFNSASTTINEHCNTRTEGGAWRFDHLRDFQLLNQNIAQYIDMNEYLRQVKNLKKWVKILGDKYDLRVEADAVEIDDIKYRRIMKSKVLFQMCMIQNSNQRGIFELYRKPGDIAFCKGMDIDSEDDYVQALLPAYTTNFRLFPKYMSADFIINPNTLKLEYMYRNINNYEKVIKQYPNHKIPVNITFYNRTDTCPNQTEKYLKYIEMLQTNPKYSKYNFTVTEIGYENDIQHFNLINVLDTTDIFLYTEPDHRDTYPNTILQAISRMALILHIKDDTKVANATNGIWEIESLFRSRFINSMEDLEKHYKDRLFGINPKKHITAIKRIIKHKLKSLDLLVHMYLVDKLENELRGLLKDLGYIETKNK